MIQGFVLEVIQDVSFYQRVKTKRGTVKRLRHRSESSFFKLRAKTMKGIQKEIESLLEKRITSFADWKVYTSFPFE